MSRPKLEKTSTPGVFKREGALGTTYNVVIDVGVDENGRRKQKWHHGYHTLREAKQARADIIGRLDRGTYVAPSKLTLNAFVKDEWLPAIEGRLRPSTFASYHGNMLNHVLPELGSRRLQQITPAMLNRLYGNLSTKLAPATTRYVHLIVRRAFADAVRWDRLALNPADRVDPPKRRTPPPMYTWSAEQLSAFLEHVGDDRLYPAWRFAAMTGVRRGELLGLHWRDLDLDSPTPRAAITETLIGARQSSTPKTEQGRRKIDLDPKTVAVLRAHRRRQAEEKLAAGPAYDDQGLVFCREDGSPLWPRSFSRMFDRHSKAADLRGSR